MKDTEKGNTDWKYVANTIDPLTSNCHIHFKIYEVLKLQWSGLLIRETFANNLFFQCRQQNHAQTKSTVDGNSFIP